MVLMHRYVAFLRAVNVDGASTVKMDSLRRVFEGLGFSNVSSFIASGNIVFETAVHSTGLLEEQIERGLLQALGKDFTPFVRTVRELAQIVSFDAYPGVKFRMGDQLAVVFLTAEPESKATAALGSFQSVRDEFRCHGREIYWLRHTEAEEAAYSTVPLEKVLREPFTIRSLSTLKKLAEKYVRDVDSESHS